MRKPELKRPKLVTFLVEEADDADMRKIAKASKMALGRLLREGVKSFLASRRKPA